MVTKEMSYYRGRMKMATCLQKKNATTGARDFPVRSNVRFSSPCRQCFRGREKFARCCGLESPRSGQYPNASLQGLNGGSHFPKSEAAFRMARLRARKSTLPVSL